MRHEGRAPARTQSLCPSLSVLLWLSARGRDIGARSPVSYPYVLASLLASVLLHVMAFVMMIGEKQPGNVLMCKIKTF